MCEPFLWVCACVSAVPAEARSEFSGARVTGSCELGPLEEQPSHLFSPACLTRTLISSFKLFVIRTQAQWVHCQPSCILWNRKPFVEEYAWINIWRKIDTEHDIRNCSTAVTLGKWQVGVLQRDNRCLKQAGHLMWSQPATVPSLCLKQCSQSVGSF